MSNSGDNPKGISRRDFIATGALAGAGAFVPHSLSAAESSVAGGHTRKRFAHVGTGSRSRVYRGAIEGKYAPYAEYVGFCDINPGRLKLFQSKVEAATGKQVPTFGAAEFDRMIAETKPDTVIVTTVDSTHDQYVIRAMELGCDGVMLASAVAKAHEPVGMANAMRHAIEGGRLAHLSGRIPRKRHAEASSPERGVIGT